MDELIGMNFREARHFRRLVDLGPEGPPAEGWLSSWQERERELLEARLLEARIFRLDLPRGIIPQRAEIESLLVEFEALMQGSRLATEHG